MIVYKFGGASVNSAGGVRNLAQIVRKAGPELFIVASAMGKTTNALEGVLERMLAGDKQAAMEEFRQVEQSHRAIVEGLFGSGARPGSVEALYGCVREMIEGFEATESPTPEEYDRAYDALVSHGELLSTTIISEYLAVQGIANRWVDMRECLVTDERHRAADVLMDESAVLLRRVVERSPERVFVGQGFIGATGKGETTTLGREGSDYSAAVVANLLDASEVVIWKDVPGILNADPRLFSDTLLIPELTYLDAVELAYSGAQVIHPKTIKPLQNKDIPLRVRPFADHDAPGSVIGPQMQGRIEAPILILKRNQVLVSIRPKDFSFVLEERLIDILSLFDRLGVKVNLIQTSAVNLSLCVDASRNLGEVLDELQADFRVVYNDNMELLTIRGYTPGLYARHAQAPGVFLSQHTRRIVRIVRKVT